MQFILRFPFCSHIVKVNQTSEMLINKRFLQKQYLKYPKQVLQIDGTLEDLYFKFHCQQISLTFDQKMCILQNMLRISQNQSQLNLYGLGNIIRSLQTDLSSLSYADNDEYNISEFINILHRIEFFDIMSWVVAMDNYHKQGILNWVQFREFTHAVYDFSFFLQEEWHINIVKDISQEAWNDFVGFVENKYRLELSEEEILQTYIHLRKFNIQANRNHLLSIIQYFLVTLTKKQKDKIDKINSDTYRFLLSFVLDNAHIKELYQGNVTLFNKILEELFKDSDEFKEFYEILASFDQYLQLLGTLITLNYQSTLNSELRNKLQECLKSMFMRGELKKESYNSIKNLVELKKLLKQDSIFIKDKEEMLQMIDEFNMNNLRNMKHQKQDLLSIIECYNLLEDKQTYLNVLAKSNIQLSDVQFKNDELIQCFKQIDDNDIVYYLQDFLEQSLSYVATEINQFSAEDWCFSFYLIYKYIVKDHQNPSQFDDKMNILKQYIKLHYMTNYRRALPVNSSYYKILTVVDVETFYADDISNYY